MLQKFVNSVIHADCIYAMKEMPNESIDFVVADPPYLVNYRPRDGRQCLNDNNPYWLKPSFRELYRVLKPDRFCVCFYGWPWVDLFVQTWKQSGFRLVSHLTWIKSHCSREGYTKGQHEVGYLLAKGRPPRPDEPLLDVLPWEYTGNKHHPNEKPVIAIRPLIETYSEPGDIVLDPFAGSGTTGVAARMCGRRFILVEKVWRYYQTALKRLK